MEAKPVQKNNLLDACVGFVSANGLKDLSLRSLALGVNMSARMLLHYFGNSETLFKKIMQEFISREKSRADQMIVNAKSSANPLRSFLEEYSQSLTNRNNLAIVNSIFEMYGSAILGNQSVSSLLKELLNHWLLRIRELDSRLNHEHATVIISFANGLVFDLLATGDLGRVRKSIEVFSNTINSQLEPWSNK